jgi:hypothetical protein
MLAGVPVQRMHLDRAATVARTYERMSGVAADGTILDVFRLKPTVTTGLHTRQVAFD